MNKNKIFVFVLVVIIVLVASYFIVKYQDKISVSPNSSDAKSGASQEPPQDLYKVFPEINEDRLGSFIEKTDSNDSTEEVINAELNNLYAAAGKPSSGGSQSRLPSCLSAMSSKSALADYVTYLTSNARIVRVMNPCSYSSETVAWMISKLEETEATGLAPSAPLPDDYYVIDPDVNNYLNFGAQTAEIYGAKLAHILWIEVRNKVPWKLANYSDADLKLIFQICKSCANNVLDHSPRIAWDLISQKINISVITNQVSAMQEITKHTREFRHGAVFLDSSGNIIRRDDQGIVTLDQMATEKISRHGCWSMVAYMLQLAEAMNIPSEMIYGYYAAGGHLTAAFRYNNQVLAHGDDVYWSLLDNTSVRNLYDSYTRWAREILRYKEGDLQAGYNSQIHSFENARLYPSEWLMRQYCSNPTIDRRAFLDKQFTYQYTGFPLYATTSQLNDLESRILSTTNDCSVFPLDNPEGNL